MDTTNQKMLKIIKVEQNCGKIISMKDLTYQKLLEKLGHGFEIKINHQYYHLYYFDEKERKITINSPEDYQIFVQSQYKKKLFICRTTKSILSMTNYKFSKVQNQEELEIQNDLKQTKQKLSDKLIQFKKKLSSNIKNLLKQNIQELRNKYLQKDAYQMIHQNQRCKNCKSNQMIKGTLYKCAFCQFTLCFKCQQQIQHSHPFYKIISKTQKIPKRSFQPDIDSHQIQQKKQEKNTKLAKQFANIVECDLAKALKLISRHPKANIDQLVQIYYNDQLPN